jgi:DNA-binding PadR family transcriptional regulator
MTNSNDLEKYIPLSETTFYILAALNEPLHGYAIMQKVEIMSEGLVKLGPGTLYGAFSNLEKEKIIRMIHEENRRKVYQLTEKGQAVLQLQVVHLKMMLKNA